MKEIIIKICGWDNVRGIGFNGFGFRFEKILVSFINFVIFRLVNSFSKI